MATVASRTFRSCPERDAGSTWAAIVSLLTKGKAGAKRDELVAVGGIAASIIADEVPATTPIVVTCNGPRTRIYCLYREDAVEGSDANENPLGFDPLEGDWAVSLPCTEKDLGWVGAALEKHSTRITARDCAEQVAKSADEGAAAGALVLDLKGFLGS